MDISQDRGGSDDHIVLPRSLGCPQSHKKRLQSQVDNRRHTDASDGIAADGRRFFPFALIQQEKADRNILK